MRAAGRTPSPWWVAVVAGMASYIDSTTIVSSGIALTIYQESLGLAVGVVGALSALLTFAIAIGALTGGRLGDRFGRRRVFMVTMVLIVIGAAILALAGTFPLLLLGTALVGLGTGADLPVSISTIAEVATDKNRGKLIGFSQVLWTVGIVAASLGGTFFGGLGRLGGTLLWAHVGLIAAIVFALRISVPESSHWLDAERERQTGAGTIRADRATLRALLAPRYLVPFIGLLVFYALTNLSANTGGQFATYLLVNVAGTSVQVASAVGLIFVPIGIVLALWYMAIVDTPKRFPFFVVGAVCTILGSLIITVLGFTLVTYIVAQLFVAVGSAFAFEALMKYWSQQSFPTLLRGTAQGTIVGVARIAAALLAFVTPALAAAGTTLLYGTLTLLNVVGLVVAFVVFRRRDTHDEFAVEAEADPEAAVAH